MPRENLKKTSTSPVADPRAIIERHKQEARKRQQERREKNREEARAEALLHVKRGQTPNTIGEHEKHYGFLAKAEGPPGGPWHVSLECTAGWWMDDVWEEMKALGYAAAIETMLASSTFHAAFDALSGWQYNRLADACEWFLERIVDRSRGLPPLSIFDVTIDEPTLLAQFESETIDLATWYEVSTFPCTPTKPEPVENQPEQPIIGMYQEYYLDAPYQSPPEQRVLTHFRRVPQLFEPREIGKVSQGTLLALHYDVPHDGGLAPSGSPPPGTSVGPTLPSGAGDMEVDPLPLDLPLGPPLVEPVHRGIAKIRRLLGQLYQHLVDTFSPPPPPAFAFAAAGGALPSPFAHRRLTGSGRSLASEVAAPLQYSGTPIVAGVGLANPMHLHNSCPVCGRADIQPNVACPNCGNAAPTPIPTVTCPQCNAGPCAVDAACAACATNVRRPLVAIFNIGQGNCNALIDNQGRIIAYYDMGYSSKIDRRPVPDFVPCVCHSPVVIISHWDNDHIQLPNVTSAKEICGVRWIAPQEDKSGLATTVKGLVKKLGGDLWLVKRVPTGERRHIRFPWGYMEVASGSSLNDSGLVMYVCVRDDPAGIIGAAAVSDDDAIKVQKGGTDITRSRAAVAAVRVKGEPPPRTEIAIYIAAALGASCLELTDAECATVALEVAQTALGGALDAAAIAATVKAMPAVLAGIPDRDEIIQDAADAAYDIMPIPAGSPRERAEATAAQVRRPGSVEEAGWSVLIAAAARPAMKRPRACKGPAPFQPGERFVLLSSDTGYGCVPSAKSSPAPTVVGLLALHHGANTGDKGDADPLLRGDLIPWAPGSMAARAAVAAHDAVNAAPLNPHSVVQAATAAAWSGRGAGVGARTILDIKQTTAHVTAAAVAALLAVDETLHDQLTHYDEDTNRAGDARRRFAVVAATAALAACAPEEPFIVGLAAALSAAITPSTAHPADLVSIARALHAEVGRSDAELIEIARAKSKGSFHNGGSSAIVSAFRQAIAAVPAGSAMSAPNVQNAATTAHEALVVEGGRTFREKVGLDRDDQTLIGSLATAAMAGRGSAVAVGSELRAARIALGLPVAPAKEAEVSAVLRAGPADAGARPADLQEMARFAARWAAEGAAAHEADASVGIIGAALDASTGDGHDVHRSRDAGSGIPSGRIAYSYGVHSGDFTHEYPTSTMGNFCHPHPLAIAKYEARGWIERRNTSPIANHAGSQGDPLSPRGPVALAWDSGNDRPIPAGDIHYTCNGCGLTLMLKC